MELVEKFMTQNPCYKKWKKIRVTGLVLHSVGCPQPSAEVFIRQMNQASAKTAVHGFIDANSGTVYQTLPWDYRAWHCGGSGNSTHIGVEMCEPPCMKYTGGATFQCTDQEKARAMVKRTCEAAAELFAFLCKKYGLDPLGDGVIISHKEAHDRGLASGHGDPDHLFRQLQMEYSMNDFRKAVHAAMGTVSEETAKAVPCQERTTLPETAQKNTACQMGKSVKTGALVTLSPEAVYYNGKEIPGWVKSDRWIVKSVKGDRAVIDGNESGTKAISSPVNLKYLTEVKR